MQTEFNVESLKVSWTKYDIVHALDIFESKETLEAYYNGEAELNRPILKAVLGIASDQSPIPEFWYEVIDRLETREKNYFIFFAILFTNNRILNAFSQCYTSPFKGIYQLETGKEGTNTRSLLVESGLASSAFRRKDTVPFDGSILLNSTAAGCLFKQFLQNLLSVHSNNYNSDDFESICRSYRFHKCLGLSFERFISWLNGVGLSPNMCVSLQFENFLCFEGAYNMDFGSSSEVYIVGENGDGKSLILYLIYLVYNGAYVQKHLDAKDVGDAVSWMNKCPNLLSGVDDLGQTYTLKSAPLFKNFYAYGTHRGLWASDGDEFLEPHGFMTLFNNNLKLIDPIRWLKDLYFRFQGDEVENAFDLFDKVSTILSVLLEEKVRVIIEGTEVYFLEKDYKLKLDMLSEGYRGVIIMTCDLLARIMDKNGYDENVFNTPGVVLIDEICQHLHPRWQRVIVSKLRSIFPNMQFIISTHSPFVIQGASDGAIAFRVYRENGCAYISEPYKIDRMREMMLNTLVTSSLFGVDSAAMEGAEEIDTSESYIVSRINKAVKEELAKLRANGHTFISSDVIDEMIRKVLNEEMHYD